MEVWPVLFPGHFTSAKEGRYPLNKTLDKTHGLDVLDKRNYLASAEMRTLDFPARMLVSMPTTISRLKV
jgi:hypothetical protein